MTRRLVFVHGRAQQGKSSAELREEWEAAWHHGLALAGVQRPAGVAIDVPFYGDTLDALRRDLDRPTTGVPQGPTPGAADRALLAELADAYATLRGLTRDDIAAALPDDAKGPIEQGRDAWAWLLATLSALDRPLGGALIRTVLEDVWAYLAFPQVQRQVDARVAPAIGSDATVVVGHSLGSVVAYNCLRTAPTAATRLFVTVGSPLAVAAVKRQLRPLTDARVPAWFDARDPGDVVALHAVDPVHFPVVPAIEHTDGVVNETHGHHGIAGYLSDPVVAERIARALR